MKKMYFFAALLAAAVFTSCDKNQESCPTCPKDPDAPTLRVVPTLESGSRAGFSPKESWQANDAIGLFVYKSTGWGTAYPGYTTVNNKSTKGSSSWVQETPIYLSAEQAKVWAYFPYSSSVANGTQVPVSITSATPDYMWGESSNLVSVVSSDATIPMKHALSQLTIRLKPSPNYQGNQGLLTSAKIKAKSPKFGTTGTMDISNSGRITFTPSLTEMAWAPNTSIPAAGRPSVYFNAAIFPMSLAQSEVVLEVVIDGAKYKYDIPQGSWVAGKRHVYSIVMEKNDASIGGDNGLGVTIEPWSSEESDIPLVPIK